MKTIQVALPERIARELDSLKRTGWFQDESEIIQLALMDFARLNQYALPFERDEYAHAPEPLTPARIQPPC